MNEQFQVMLDKQALTDLVSQYAISADTYDAELLASLWMEDGVYDFPGGWEEPVVGRDAIVEVDFRLMRTYQVVQHLIANPYFTINGDTAQGRTNIIFHGCTDKTQLEQHVSAGGYYEWTFQRTAQGWKIKTLYLGQLWATGKLGVEDSGAPHDQQTNPY